jgi:hypothetical protein
LSSVPKVGIASTSAMMGNYGIRTISGAGSNRSARKKRRHVLDIAKLGQVSSKQILAVGTIE